MLFPSREFRAQLILHDLKIRHLSAHFGVARSTVSQIINNFWKKPAISSRCLRMLDDMKARKFTRLEDY